jgi:hypothetical protein
MYYLANPENGKKVVSGVRKWHTLRRVSQGLWQGLFMCHLANLQNGET